MDKAEIIEKKYKNYDTDEFEERPEVINCLHHIVERGI